jgi:hypothetical protein
MVYIAWGALAILVFAGMNVVHYLVKGAYNVAMLDAQIDFQNGKKSTDD